MSVEWFQRLRANRLVCLPGAIYKALGPLYGLSQSRHSDEDVYVYSSIPTPMSDVNQSG